MADADVHPSPVSPGEAAFTATLDVDQTDKAKKHPKRILHFSDGILEEYSSDESEDDTSPMETRVDPRMLTWGPWCLYYVSCVAKKSFGAAEYCGEKLAWLFGITTPKYKYAIEEYKRVQREIELEQSRDQKEKEESQGLATIEVQVVDGKKHGGSQQTDDTHGPEKY